jgi:hypothetical protein
MRPLTAPRPGMRRPWPPRRPQADASEAGMTFAAIRRPAIWAYRMQRVMLTPYLRALLRVGLPSLAVLAVAAIYLADEARRAAHCTGSSPTLREKFEQPARVHGHAGLGRGLLARTGRGGARQAGAAAAAIVVSTSTWKPRGCGSRGWMP